MNGFEDRLFRESLLATFHERDFLSMPNPITLKALCVSVCFLNGLLIAAPGLRAETPIIIAHRGASHDAPENTIAAFKLAFEQGADGIEGDFYLSKDHQ